VRELGGGLELQSSHGNLRSQRLITCGGLHADRLARLTGSDPAVRIIPFRGEYYYLRPERRDLVRGLIYPVPDPDLPFLGVHFTRTVHGEVEAGPNAVFALAREGYDWTRVSLADLAETFAYPGFWRLARRVWRIGAYEMVRSLSTATFVRSLRKLVPSVMVADVRRGGAGVRAQAVGRDGRLLDDFAFAEGPRALHLLNAPSPAATAALAIGAHLAERVTPWFGER
jgi:(S)-2-hydroxyglutarate dehydrogenase